MPPAMTADTGVDALTHALEACVSIFASPYTDAFCLQALHLILDALPRAVRRRRGPEGAHRMANAATIAGLAFSNAFVGVNHALAHARRRALRHRPRPGERPLPAARPALQRRRCRASSCRRPATAPTWRPRSTRRPPGSSGSAAAPRRSRASASSRASTSCCDAVGMPRTLGRGRHRPGGVSRRDPRSRARRVPRREPAHEPAHADDRRAARAAGRLRAGGA